MIHLMEEQKAIDTKGGTMRLGSYPCVLQNETLAAKLYGREKISERHRHRYEFNNSYRAEFGAKGMVLERLVAGQQLGRDHRAQGPSVVSRLPVSPGVQVAADGRAIRCSAVLSKPR